MSVIRIKMENFDKDKHGENLRVFDNTKLVALNTCPTWGIITYEHHKVMYASGRAMALEAGHASHEAYSGVRLADLWFNGHTFYDDEYLDKHANGMNLYKIVSDRAHTLFGETRANTFLACLTSGEDPDQATMLGALDLFNSSGYYDDPYDNRRTIANIEESLIAYCNRYPFGKTMPVIIDGFVGVEIPINMYLEIETDDQDGDSANIYKYNFTGRVDGVHFDGPNKSRIVVEENKTASRLDDAWRMSFTVGHQPTGYCVAIGAKLDKDVRHAVIRGMAIPLPKTYDYGGIVNEPVQRTDLQFVEWAEWVHHTAQITERYVDNPWNAPQYTHSCNRYFRPCPMIPFCDSDKEERKLMLEDMHYHKWSPLEEGNE